MSHPLYATPAFRAVCGDLLRPGGLELTRHGLELLFERGLLPGMRVLDAGCGPAVTTALLASSGFQSVGVDWHPGQGGKAPCPGVQLVCGDLEELPFADSSFQACIAECVLSLVGDTVFALRQFYRVLVPGGLVLVTDLLLRESEKACEASGRQERGTSCLGGARTPAEWQNVFADAGFELIAREDHSHALATLMARLVWYDAAEDLKSFLPAGACTQAAQARRNFGYGLFLLRRRT